MAAETAFSSAQHALFSAGACASSASASARLLRSNVKGASATCSGDAGGGGTTAGDLGHSGCGDVSGLCTPWQDCVISTSSHSLGDIPGGHCEAKEAGRIGFDGVEASGGTYSDVHRLPSHFGGKGPIDVLEGTIDELHDRRSRCDAAARDHAMLCSERPGTTLGRPMGCSQSCEKSLPALSGRTQAPDDAAKSACGLTSTRSSSIDMPRSQAAQDTNGGIMPGKPEAAGHDAGPAPPSPDALTGPAPI